MFKAAENRDAESPMSPPPKKAKMAAMMMMQQQQQAPQQSLLDMWTSRLEKENSRKHVPFHGTRNLGDKVKLYLNFEARKAKEQQQQAVAMAAGGKDDK